MADPTPLRLVLADCRRLLSVRGEANGPLLARQIAQRIDALSDEQRTRFFDRLASDFSPDPQAVLAAAQAYADDAGRADPDPPDARWPNRRARSCSGASTARRAAPRPSCACAARCSRSCRASRNCESVEHDLLHLLSSLVQPGFSASARGRLELAGATARADHPPRGGAPDRRLGRPAPPPATRPALLRLLPPAVARRAADLRRGGAAARDGRGDRAADRQALGAAAGRAVQGGGVLFDQQLPARAARRVAGQLPDQARGRVLEARTAATQDLLHPVADPRL